MSDINEDGRIPITLLTGFLGAGKTTMLNRLLSDPDSGQIAVIVNEFGEIGIDGDLIVRRDEEMMELSNGCICCEGKDDLVGALYSLYKKRLGLEKPKISFDRVIIETTGLADPAPLAQLFFTDMNLCLTFQMDAIVTMVDLGNVMTQISHSEEAKKQIAISDKIILNKRDLVTQDQFDSVYVKIRSLNPLCPIEITTNANLKACDLLNLGLFNPIQKEAAIHTWLGADNSNLLTAHHHKHGESCEICDAEHKNHLQDISAISIREEKPIFLTEIRSFTEMGSPCNKPRDAPSITAFSAALACCIARSGVNVAKQLSLGSRVSIRSSVSFISSTGEISFSAIAFVNSIADLPLATSFMSNPYLMSN